jgi:hypothetical protein
VVERGAAAAPGAALHALCGSRRPLTAAPRRLRQTQAAIAGGSFVNMLFNLVMRHPWDPGRPLVDLDLALVLTPALLLGVSVGEAGQPGVPLVLNRCQPGAEVAAGRKQTAAQAIRIGSSISAAHTSVPTRAPRHSRALFASRQACC